MQFSRPLKVSEKRAIKKYLKVQTALAKVSNAARFERQFELKSVSKKTEPGQISSIYTEFIELFFIVLHLFHHG